MAAAIGVGLPVVTPRGSMVVNIGGGTTEIGVIALSGIVADASIRVGGNELDEAITAFVRKSYNLLIGEATAESIKIQIGSAYPRRGGAGDGGEGPRPGLRHPEDGAASTPPRSATAIQEPIQAIVEAVRRALEVTPPELASDIVDEGIVMTGGGAQLRGLDRLLSEETGLPIHVDAEPLTCVVRGAGIGARRLADLPGRGHHADGRRSSRLSPASGQLPRADAEHRVERAPAHEPGGERHPADDLQRQPHPAAHDPGEAEVEEHHPEHHARRALPAGLVDHDHRSPPEGDSLLLTRTVVVRAAAGCRDGSAARVGETPTGWAPGGRPRVTAP